MFIGSINRHMRDVLRRLAPAWKDLPVYVACSGNFTVERILATLGVGELHSNDVSIYSCALGWHLSGRGLSDYRVAEDAPAWAWLADYLDGGEGTLAALMLLSEMLKYDKKKPTPYHERMLAAYRESWPAMHARTVEKVKRALGDWRIAAFFAGDCREFVADAPREAVCVSFPPTYKGGYESLYRKLDSVIEWPAPAYEMFDPGDFEKFVASVRSFRHWMTSSDQQCDELADHLVARVQTGVATKPVFIYAGGAKARCLTAPHQKTAPRLWPPCTGEIAWPLAVVRIDGRMMNTLRSQYLAKKIIPVGAGRNYAVLTGGSRVVGAFSFSLPRPGGIDGIEAYLMSDFAVRPTPYRRLSKLVLACVVSTELRTELEQWLCRRVATIGTTAFTDKPVSMKYRGLFKVHSRGEGRVNYIGPAGRWSLSEGAEWWQGKHSRK